MKNLKFLTVLALSLFIFNACQTEDNLISDDQEVNDKYRKKLKQMHFNTINFEVVDFELPNGTTQEMIQIEDDIVFSKEQIDAMSLDIDYQNKNYRTNNLVYTGSGTRTISIIGYTGGGGYGLSSKERTGLQWAVNNYNRLNLKIRFNLSFGTGYQSKDMVVYHNPNQSGSGGQAGFPSGGNPFKWVQVYGLNGLSTNVHEHVICHEIGHSVGFRHTDWFSRQSCGQNQNEGTADGAIAIPGTSSGYDPTSIMLACFSNNTGGEFNNNDRIALNYLY